jgi:SAM-dependent methyltransferase
VHTDPKEKSRQRLLPGLSVKDGFTRHPFDIANSVRTSGLIAGRHLTSGHAHDRHATAYYGVAPSVFHALLKRWQRTKPAAALEDFTFLDVGAGMGRAMLLAAELPFREVVGIELHPTLAGIARKNLTLWRKAGKARTRARLICGDAVEFALPPGPCLAFLFNPFGAPVMRKLLAQWVLAVRAEVLAAPASGHEKILDLLYVNNEQERVLEQQKGFSRLFLGQIPRSRADAIADHTILANQPDGEYASSNTEDCSIYRWVGLEQSQ